MAVNSIVLQNPFGDANDGNIITGDILGRIGFSAPSETGADALLVAALISAVAEEPFTSSANKTKILFSTASGDVATARLAVTGDGHLVPADDDTYDLGTASLQFRNGYFDGTLEADAITLGGTALGSLYSVIAGSSSIVTTGALNSGSITSGFGAIDNGSSNITTTGTLDISGGTLTLAANQISGDKVEGGTIAATTITALTTAGITATANIDIGAYELRAQTLESDVATGTAPLTVTSTTVVSNLNADKLDGQEGSYYLDFGNFVIDADEIPISKLASDSVSYGGVSVTLGASDATPAFALADATGLPIVAGTTGTLTVARGGTGVSTLTDGGILLGSGTGAITALAVLGDGVIVVGDNDVDPTTITAFTASDGVLKHEVGGIEADISAIAVGGVLVGTGTGTMGILAHAGGGDDGKVLTVQANSTVAWEAASGGGSGDVVAGSTFTTAGVIMAAHGDDKKIDEPNTTLTTNGQAMTVSAAVSTPFTANAGAGTSNCTFVFQSGTGDTNNNAIIKLISGTAASSYLYMGDASDPDRGHIRYNNSTDSMLFKVNAATAITIAAEGDVTFSKAIKPAAPAGPEGGSSAIVILDCNDSNHFAITTTGNITGWSFLNASTGQRIIVRVTNGASHTVGFSTTGEGDVVHFPGGTEPVLTVSGGIDVYGFLCTTGSSDFDGFIVGQDIKA